MTVYVISMSRFARLLGYQGANDPRFRTRLKVLLARGEIKVQRSGYRGDMKHKQLVLVSRVQRKGWRKIKTNWTLENNLRDPA